MLFINLRKTVFKENVEAIRIQTKSNTKKTAQN